MNPEKVGISRGAFEDSALAVLFTPDTILPEQYADGLRTYELSPEKRLYLAILEDAIDCWLKGGPTVASKIKRNQGIEADRWIWGNDGEVSFADCCEALGILPEWLRTKLEAKRHQRPMKLRGGGHRVPRGRTKIDLALVEYEQPVAVAD